jgi:hypothetical protein
MKQSQLSFFNRLTLALRAFGRILTDDEFAGDILRLERGNRKRRRRRLQNRLSQRRFGKRCRILHCNCWRCCNRKVAS